MNCYRKIIGLVLFFILTCNVVDGQSIDRQKIEWQNKTIYLGPVLAENGITTVEFFGINSNKDSLFITDIITDCGCTVVDFSKDTVATDQPIRLSVSYESDYRGGEFSKVILVRTNLDIYGDTLILQGYNFPVIDDPIKEFPYKFGPLGFRLPIINLGQILTNEPKVKFYDVFNFSKDSTSLSSLEMQNWPDYIQLTLEPTVLGPSSRGLLSIRFDGDLFGDFGYFKEELPVQLMGFDSRLVFTLTGTLFEFFEPVPKSMERVVPKLQLSDNEFDLKEIPASRLVNKTVQLTNLGQEPLIIRKVITSCDCVTVELTDSELLPNNSTNLTINFNPKGRRGIDHKHITIFTNDPVTPVRTITLRSMIK